MNEHKLNKVLKYLQQNGSGSKLEIFNATKYWNVSDAVMKFRRRGHNIVTTWERSSTGARYAVFNYRGIKDDTTRKNKQN